MIVALGADPLCESCVLPRPTTLGFGWVLYGFRDPPSRSSSLPTARRAKQATSACSDVRSASSGSWRRVDVCRRRVHSVLFLGRHVCCRAILLATLVLERQPHGHDFAAGTVWCARR